MSKAEQTKREYHAGSVRMTELHDSHPELDNSEKKTPLEWADKE